MLQTFESLVQCGIVTFFTEECLRFPLEDCLGGL